MLTESLTKITPCLEVWLRFKEPHMQVVRINRFSGDTRTHHLNVVNNGHTLSVQFVDKEGAVVREVNYNFSLVLEYDCQGWVEHV